MMTRTICEVASPSNRERATFASWQPIYSAHGIATFPMKAGTKSPAIRGYARIGLRGSQELAGKFPTANSFAFMCGASNRITLADVDSRDERVLADVLARHGNTPVIARTPGGWHAYYRNAGECRRRIKYQGRPYDVLGGGLALAPPSIIKPGKLYEFVQGTLEDLDQLPVMCGLTPDMYALAEVAPAETGNVIKQGRRNVSIFNYCMRRARDCTSFDALLDAARACNARCSPMLPDTEVVSTACSAWGYQQRGENRFGQHGAFLPTALVRELVRDPYLLSLIGFLKGEYRPDATFMIADGLAEKLRWPRRKFQDARRSAIKQGLVIMVSEPRRGRAARYRFGKKS